MDFFNYEIYCFDVFVKSMISFSVLNEFENDFDNIRSFGLFACFLPSFVEWKMTSRVKSQSKNQRKNSNLKRGEKVKKKLPNVLLF